MFGCCCWSVAPLTQTFHEYKLQIIGWVPFGQCAKLPKSKKKKTEFAFYPILDGSFIWLLAIFLNSFFESLPNGAKRGQNRHGGSFGIRELWRLRRSFDSWHVVWQITTVANEERESSWRQWQSAPSSKLPADQRNEPTCSKQFLIVYVLRSSAVTTTTSVGKQESPAAPI